MTLLLLVAFSRVSEAAPTAGAVPVILNDAKPEALFASATYLDDPEGSYDIDDVSRGNARGLFARLPPKRLLDRTIRGWFRLALRVAPKDAGRFAITSNPSADIFDVYFPRANGTYGVTHAGMLVPFAERDQTTPLPFVPVSPELESGRPVYLYVVANSSFNTGPDPLFYVIPKRWVAAEYKAQQLRDNFFFGLFIALFVTNLFLGFYLRERLFVIYALALILHVLTQFTQDGTAWQIFWPHASIPFNMPSVALEWLFTTSLALFWRMFLNLPGERAVIDRVLLGAVGLSALRTSLLLSLPQAGWLSYTNFPNAYLLILITLAGAVSTARSGYRPARFLIVALSGMLFFWFMAYLPRFVDLDQAPEFIANLVENGLYYGVAWDALFLTFALADRIETTRRGMIAAQQEALAAQAETVDRLRERDVAMSRFLPRAFLEDLGRDNVVELQLGDHVEREMTVLFSDIRSFTALSESMSPEQTFRFLNAYLRRAGPIIRAHKGFVDKYIGDALMGLFPNEAHTAVDAAIEMQRSVHDYNRERARAGYPAIAIGVGLHRGRLMLGAIGESERIETTVIADAVNVASRIEALTKQLRAPVIVSGSVISAIAQPAGYCLRPLGDIVVYGATRGMAMFEVFDGDAPEVLLKKMLTLDDFTAGVRAFTEGNFPAAEALFARVLQESSTDQTAAYYLQQTRLLSKTPAPSSWDGRIRIDMK